MSVSIKTLDSYSRVDSTSLLNNISAYWKFDEEYDPMYPSWTALDSTGNGNNAPTGNVIIGVGVIGNCYDFRGISSSVIVGDKLKFTSAFSFSFWFKNTANGSEQYFIEHTGYDGAWKGYRFTIYETGSIGIMLADGNNSHVLDVAYSSLKNDGNWHHVVVTFNGSIVYVYLDGVKNSGWSWPYTLAYVSPGTNMLIGVGFGSVLYLNGELDEIGAWERALTDSEAAELYNTGSGNTYPFS